MKKRFQNEIDEQETLKKHIKIETEKTYKVNKIKINSKIIKRRKKRETKDLRIRRVSTLN